MAPHDPQATAQLTPSASQPRARAIRSVAPAASEDCHALLHGESARLRRRCRLSRQHFAPRSSQSILRSPVEIDSQDFALPTDALEHSIGQSNGGCSLLQRMNTPSVHRFVSAKRPMHINPKIGRRREPTDGDAYTSEVGRGYSEGRY